MHGHARAGKLPPPAITLVVGPDGGAVEAGPRSCFSFESDISRGLRSESVILHQDETVARVTHEYSLVGDHDALVVSQRIATERGIPGVMYPLTAPIATRDRCALTGVFADGSTFDRDIVFELPEQVFWAEALEVWDGESRYTVVSLDGHGRVTMTCVAIVRDPRPAVALGGRLEMAIAGEHQSSFMIVRGDLDDEIVTRALAGRLPAQLVTEIAAGAASEPNAASATPARPEA
jgi:hypothetical protein